MAQDILYQPKTAHSALSQPLLGVTGSVVVIFLALGFSAVLSPTTINGWVALVMNAAVPTLVVQTTVWRENGPAFRLFTRQPARGIAGIAIMAVFAAVIATSAIFLFGNGHPLPTPIVIIPLVSAVLVTLWQVFLFDCWPFSFLTRSVVMKGLLMLAASYAVTVIGERLLFDYNFLQSAPFYNAALDPHGPFDARNILAILIASVDASLVLVALDFAPVTGLARGLPALERQPWRGIFGLMLVLCIATAVWAACVPSLGMDIAVFQARVCVSFLFGMFVLLVMLQGNIFIRHAQPMKGMLISGMAALIATAAYALYHLVAVRLCNLVDLMPSRDLETWISTTMLAITFPGMGIFADLLEFWPLRRCR